MGQFRSWRESLWLRTRQSSSLVDPRVMPSPSSVWPPSRHNSGLALFLGQVEFTLPQTCWPWQAFQTLLGVKSHRPSTNSPGEPADSAHQYLRGGGPFEHPHLQFSAQTAEDHRGTLLFPSYTTSRYSIEYSILFWCMGHCFSHLAERVYLGNDWRTDQ